jgi:hypothetical protein
MTPSGQLVISQRGGIVFQNKVSHKTQGNLAPARGHLRESGIATVVLRPSISVRLCPEFIEGTNGTKENL